MRSMKARHLLVVRLALLCSCAGMGGCLLVPYGYPTLSCTPLTDIGERPDEVHAYRVDVGVAVEGQCESSKYTLCEVTPWAGQVAPQACLGADCGFLLLGVLCQDFHWGRSVCLRLYRPGYELVEVQSWQTPPRVDWKEASTVEQQESSLDALLRTPWVTWRKLRLPVKLEEETPWGFDGLRPGLSSRAHRNVLLFAASEYERLANATAPVGGEFEERLRAKAAWLRQHAAK